MRKKGFQWTDDKRAELVPGVQVVWYAVLGRPECAHLCTVRGPVRELGDGTAVLELELDDGRREAAAGLFACDPKTVRVDGRPVL